MCGIYWSFRKKLNFTKNNKNERIYDSLTPRDDTSFNTLVLGLLTNQYRITPAHHHDEFIDTFSVTFWRVTCDVSVGASVGASVNAAVGAAVYASEGSWLSTLLPESIIGFFFVNRGEKEINHDRWNVSWWPFDIIYYLKSRLSLMIFPMTKQTNISF